MDPFSLVLLLLLVPLVLLSIRGSKQRKAVAQMQSELAPGTEVMTASGQFGLVTEVRADRVEIEVAPGVRTWWLRQAIARQVDPLAPADEPVDEPLADRADEDHLAHPQDDDRSDGSRRTV
ncbi:preprotein translocase subunit YajC [uncultured Pseudokineococcus sp.]|uniref:preprotein translocase subunit YajC n=1 Tax=uncultured Pseudokineococcus sp. TaxID=1642928 RepID=UPI0026246BB9|nr:preprotein translocase subunit YajC [uncultured Pseudokineococcus sp.]